ncbi:hypothetical protein HKX48_004153 [Thoreauomyces humboldtii]|nr:hypothetical protein HKX48_004153 [Thoreauomyces humboldtii]
MEPNTALNLRERKGNKLKDFVAVAGQLSVTHLMIFSKTAAGTSLRIGRIPRGPTLTFRVTSYGLSADVLALQNRPKSPGSEFKTSPLVVLNNFGGDEKHIKLMATVFQNMFPSIQVQTMKLADARRVILFNLNSETNEVEFRHYTVSVKVTGVSKSIKTIIQTQVPTDLGRYEDVSDYILRGAFASESDVEDAGESTVTLSQKYIGKGNRQQEQRAIRLVEVGPRMQMKLVKIQNGLCEGEILYHALVHKSAKEIKEQEARRKKTEEERARRRAEQEKNVANKKEAVGGDDDDEDGDEGDQGEDEDLGMDLDEDQEDEDEDANDDEMEADDHE